MPSPHSRAMNRKKKKKQKKRKKKNQRKVKEVYSAFYLAEEIIKNILKRLPVKSLVRFQSVCKNWKNLIKSQSLIDENFHLYSIQNPGILFGDHFPHDSTQLYLLNNDMKIVQLNFASVSHILRRSVMIGSSNGLICLKLLNSSHAFVLWNPSTGQLRFVPKPANGCSFRSGFGFSSILNDYNILTFDYPPDMLNLQGQVYSFKTELWKEVESSPLERVRILHESFAASGCILWVGYKYDVYFHSKEHVLVSYDMALEVFTLIPSPVSPTEGLDLLTTHITIHENKLAIFSRTSIGDPVSSLIDMWVMEDGMSESGEEYSWTKKFGISHPSLSFAVTIWRNKMVCLPWCTRATEGANLAVERKSIGLVDLTTSEVDMFDIGICGTPHPFMNHVESLLPVGNNYIEEL